MKPIRNQRTRRIWIRLAAGLAGGTVLAGILLFLTAIPQTTGQGSVPTAPSGLTATAVSTSQINLSWNDNSSNESWFKIERKIGAGGTYSEIAIVGSNITSYQDVGLAAETTYVYRVRASNAAGDSAYSNEASAATLPLQVTLPSFLPTDDAMISQDNPGTNYGSSTTLVVDNNPVEQFLMKFTITGVSGRQVVSATLSLRNTSSSDKGGDFYRVSDNSWCEISVTGCTGVTWNSAPASDASPFASLGAVSSGQTYQVNLTPLITGDGTFSMRVKSTSTDGADYYSKEYSTASRRPTLVMIVSNPAPPSLPAAPSNLTATTFSASRVDLAWNDNSSNESGFRIERKTGAGGTYTEIATVASNTTSYQNAGLAAETTYVYRVRAYNAGGYSSYSNEVSATTDTTPPSGIGNVSPSNGATNVSLTPTPTAATATDSSPPISYAFELYQGTACSGTPVQTRSYDTSASWAPTALQANTTYAWRNKARDSVSTPNESAFGSCWTFTTVPPPDTTPPAAITDLRAG